MQANIRVRLGARIRALRYDRGWTQIDLAVESGLSKDHISELELGKREICLDALCKIALALGQKSSELLASIGS